jgi:hypothetical protein
MVADFERLALGIMSSCTPMADLPRRWILVLGLACSGTATSVMASPPTVPPIDLVAEVQQARGEVVCFDCGEALTSETRRAFYDGTWSLLVVGWRIDAPDWTTQPRDDVWDPCLRSSCTTFSGEVTR